MRDGHMDHMRMFWGCCWSCVMSSAVVPIDAGHGGFLQRMVEGGILVRVFLRGFEYHGCFG